MIFIVINLLSLLLYPPLHLIFFLSFLRQLFLLSPPISGLCAMQAGRLFSNQVRIAGIHWRAAVSIDSPLHPSISRPAEALTQDGTGGRGERGGDRFKRSLLEDSSLLAESSIRHREKQQPRPPPTKKKNKKIFWNRLDCWCFISLRWIIQFLLEEKAEYQSSVVPSITRPNVV